MVDTSRYVVLAQFTAQEGQLDNLLAHVKKIRDHSLANEEGTKVYVPTQSATNPKDISIWEEYADEAAFNKHCEHEYFLDFAKSLDTLLEGGKSSIKILKQNAF